VLFHGKLNTNPLKKNGEIDIISTVFLRFFQRSTTPLPQPIGTPENIILTIHHSITGVQIVRNCRKSNIPVSSYLVNQIYSRKVLKTYFFKTCNVKKQGIDENCSVQNRSFYNLPQSVLNFPNLHMQSQQNEAVVQGRSLPPIPATV
jgi:hypothetical protein